MSSTSLTSNKAYPFLNSLDIDQDVKRRLTYSLSQVVEGNSEIFVSPFGKDGKDKLILSELDKVFNGATSEMNDVLRDLELSNRAKFGPRSIAQTWSQRSDSLYNSFESYRGKSVSVGDNSSRPKGIALRPISLEQALKRLKNGTNSGLPFYTKKGKVKDKAFNEFDILLKEGFPCILFTRTQESGKTRNVWGFPIADTLNEMRFYVPLLDYQRKHSTYRAALIGPDEVDRSVTLIVKRASETDKWMVSIDFETFDNTVKRPLQKLAFDSIKGLFQSQYSEQLDKISERFATIGIVTPDGILDGDHGVPSGSTFTNEVDSIVQYLLAKTSSLVDDLNIQIQGDDGVYLIPEGSGEDLFSHFESFGLKVSRDKSYISKDYAIYLQNLYHIDYMRNGLIGGIYPVYRAVNRICYQERWTDFEDYEIKGSDYYAIRTICILENCKYHPLFEDLVKLIYKFDKYSLKFSEQGLQRYLRMMEQTQGLGGVFINQYGENTKGIKSFESYKIISKLG